MNKILLAAVISAIPFLVHAEHNEDISLDEINVRAPLIDSRILKHPATVETFDRKQIEENLNAATSSQALKYMPSMQVRERFIGDRNGNIATRTVGTLASAQNMLFADGVLLSNFLQGNFGSPRWGMVAPEEIESISMMYGPFSALYAGNSFGGVISLVTRMPDKFEAYANVQAFTQNFELYGTDESFNGNRLNASFGNKVDDFSFWFGVDRLENRSHPIDFSTASLSTTAPGASPIVTGAYQDKNEVSKDRIIFGANGIDDSEQTNIKFKGAYDITPAIKAAYTLGVWNLDSERKVKSYVKDAAGNPVYNGRVNFNGQRYDISGMSPAEADSLHIMQALDLKSNTKEFFDWQLTLSDYDFHEDKNNYSNTPTGGTTAAGNPYLNKIGRVTDQEGTGWTVFDVRATLRPQSNYSGTHTIDVGYHVDQYELRSETNDTADWTTGSKGILFSAASGDTRTQALYAQDKWQMNPQWALTFGNRTEHWEAKNGQNKITLGGVLNTANYKDVSTTKFSPKVSLSFEPAPAWGFRASLGQAFRFPTVGELFQPLQNGLVPYFVQSNPNLNPEEVISGELTAERRFANGLVRASLFSENKYDALITQFLAVGIAIPYDTGTCTRAQGCSYTQNVDHIRTRGLELATQWQDVFVHGLDLLGSATFTDAEVLRNENAPNTVGNKPTRIPRSMFKAVATYHQGNNLTYSLAARYSGRQYNALDNSDSNPDTYGAASKYFIVDVKANYKFADSFNASVGVDNLNNYQAYVFHPYPQRTGYVQLKYDY